MEVQNIVGIIPQFDRIPSSYSLDRSQGNYTPSINDVPKQIYATTEHTRPE